jgi:hypothetical protein
MTDHFTADPDNWSSYAEDIGAPRLCAACGDSHDVVEVWVSGADQLLCRVCVDAWLRLVWPEFHGPRGHHVRRWGGA